MTETKGLSRVGVVAIGRNEGERLRGCLRSVLRSTNTVVYVDSGSTDGSVLLAQSMGVEVIELDMSQPFTAGRARNAGCERIIQRAPGIVFVQFLDGDCEIAEGWLERARVELEGQHDVAIVCGRLRERFPEASVYKRLCDMEWDTPIGEAESCGGNFMARVEALREVGAFNPRIVAGEEPELCLRLRGCSWRIVRLDAEMGLHDAAITRFRQWWRRAARGGHGFSEIAWMHGRRSGRLGIRTLMSVALWAVAVPVAAVVPAPLSGGLSLLLLAAYPVQWCRIRRGMQRRGRSGGESGLYATFVLLGKFAQLTGILRFLWLSLLRRSSTIIEYKGPTD